MTNQQFDELLLSFTEGNIPLIHQAISVVTSGLIWTSMCEEIPNSHKRSLVRKVLRYVAQTALKGTFEIDSLSVSCNFHEMEYGDPVSFAEWNNWTFFSDRLNKTINVRMDHTTATYYDEDHKLLMKVELWPGLHRSRNTGRIDLKLYFEDTRNAVLQ